MEQRGQEERTVGGNVLNDLGSDHLARTAPGGEAVEDDEAFLLDCVVPLGLPVRKLIVSIIPILVTLFTATTTYLARLWTPPPVASGADMAYVLLCERLCSCEKLFVLGVNENLVAVAAVVDVRARVVVVVAGLNRRADVVSSDLLSAENEVRADMDAEYICRLDAEEMEDARVR